VLLDSCFNPWFFFLLAGHGHIVGAGSSVLAASIKVDMKRPVRSIDDHLRSQNFCPRVRKIRSVLDTHQDIIGHDVSVRSLILPNHNEHGAFEGNGKEDVTSKVWILPSPFLFKEVTIAKNLC